ncbi:LOW QUALITY PROTEIN: uncharacterized protein LOC133345305 [Lethenteron reissneri]|uniref:LOW QUALITY PROTEIN: uncharacterized protein LOC133345305 n=1 Tax=Lethenteron reissneri TaxID=7753 RepID=UPI002AB774C1|nr:LOW QUALITY PROTEIN: uncharacterized protein LOC133345305 [Lethenteron reissneri]
MASVDENSSLGGKVGARKDFASSEIDTNKSEVKPSNVDDLSDTAVGNSHSAIPCKVCGTVKEQGDLTPQDSGQQRRLAKSKSYANSNENIASESPPEESDLKGDAGTYDLSTEHWPEAAGESEMGQSLTGCIGSKVFHDDRETIHQRGEGETGKKGGKDELHHMGNAAKGHKDLDYKEDYPKKRERQHIQERWNDTTGRPPQGGGNGPHTDDQDESGLVQSLSHQEEDMYRSEGTIDKISIGERRELVDYSCQEWKGSTAKTKKIKKAYLELSSKGYFDIRRVRGDNYCGLRATLFQAFCKQIKIFDSTVQITELPNLLNQRNKGLIENWTFANREAKDRRNQASLVICLQNLKNEWLKAYTYQLADTENFCKDLFNQLGVTEWRLYEAVKLLMLWKAMDLFEMQKRGEDVPLFATLMFARETSLNPHSFLLNHLNHVGSSGGLEQVEMCLLGYTLGITIRAFRLYMFGTEEFQVCYPESEPARGGGAVERPEVAIVTEDDRHYNVLLPSPDQPPLGHSKQPPFGNSNHPPLGDSNQPPHGHSNQPPHGNSYQPPFGHSNQPPHGHSNQPPHGHSNQPPLGDSNQPPHGHSNQPPLGDSNQPPHGHSNQPPHGSSKQPPLGNSYQPPHGNSKQPSLGDSYQPPHGNSKQPPLGDSYQPPHGSSKQPPLGDSYQPPHGNSKQPSLGDSYQPPHGSSKQPPLGDSYQPPHGSSKQPSLGDSYQPSHGSSKQPPLGDSYQPPHGSSKQPPLGDSYQPPHGNSKQPSLGDSYQPPHGNSKQPSLGDSYQPPHGSSKQPSLGDSYQPPHGSSKQPPLGDSYQPPLGSSKQPPLGDSYQPSHGNSKQPPLGDSYQPPLGSSKQPPLGDSYQPPHGSSKQPPLGDSYQPSLGSSKQPSLGNSKQPSLGDSYQPPHGSSKQPPLGDSYQPSLGNSKQPSLGDSYQPPHGSSKQPPLGDSYQPSLGSSKQPPHGSSKQPSLGNSKQPPLGSSKQPSLGNSKQRARSPHTS